MYIYEDIIWFIENTALIFFMRLACTYFLSTKYESIVVIRRSCSILARSHETIRRPGKSNFSHVIGGLITWVKLSFIVLISQSDKKKEYLKVYFDRSILYPDGV